MTYCILMAMFAIIVAIICLYEVINQRMSKYEQMLASMATRVVEDEKQPKTFEDQRAEAMEKIFNEWTTNIVNYNPYRKDDDV